MFMYPGNDRYGFGDGVEVIGAGAVLVSPEDVSGRWAVAKASGVIL